MVIVAEEEADNDLDEQIATSGHDTSGSSFLSNLLGTLAINADVLIAKPNLPIRHGTTVIAYCDLQNTEIIKVITTILFRLFTLSSFFSIQIQDPRMPNGECITKRQIYLSEPCLPSEIPIRTRVLDRSSSLLGFILEQPCLVTNNNRYLVLDDSFAARYYTQPEFHLCLCQDFRRHLLNIDYKELRTFYQHAFDCTTKNFRLRRFTCQDTIRVRKFDATYHRAEVIEIDCSIMKICFFERKSQKQMWIHSNASIIEHVSPPTATPAVATLAVEEIVENTPSDTIQLRKRKEHATKSDAGRCHFLSNNHLSLFKVDLSREKKASGSIARRPQ